jgi:hypothetical protein
VHTCLEQVRAQPTISVAVEHKRRDITLSKYENKAQNRVPTPTREENDKKDKILAPHTHIFAGAKNSGSLD